MSTPAQPGPPRRRATGIRRPRVAGRVPGRPVADAPGALFVPHSPDEPLTLEPEADATAIEETSADPAAVDRADVDPADVDPADVDRAVTAHDGSDDVRDGVVFGPMDNIDSADGAGAGDGPPSGAQPSGKRQLRRRRAAVDPAPHTPRRPIPIPVLAAALVLLLGIAVFFGVADARLRGTPAAQNTALVDIGTTAQVTQQVDDALKTIYSFDYTRLDQNETAARAVITPGFETQFNELFKQVRRLAPQQQAVVTATVNLSAVKSINGDTAVLLVFLDQQATRAQAGTQPQQLAAAGRLTVTAQRVDGTWKISDVQPR